ncbi:MAG: hypothetical protein PHW39_04060 [Syntrophomonadaceae bacterium]|nr:hypothetical protein [Syntrophomonadaceae bacterium]
MMIVFKKNRMMIMVLTLVMFFNVVPMVLAAAPQVTYVSPPDQGFFLQGRNWWASCNVTNNPTFVGFFYGNGQDPWHQELQENYQSGTTWGGNWAPNYWVKPQNNGGTWYWPYTCHYAENGDGKHWPYRYSYVALGNLNDYRGVDTGFTYNSETSHDFINVATGTHAVAHGTPNTYNCLAYSVGITDHWEWPWPGTPSYADLQTYMSNHGFPTSSNSLMPWAKVIYYNGNHFAKVTSWDSSGIPLTIRSKWGTMELINSDSYNPFTSVYGQATYYFK